MPSILTSLPANRRYRISVSTFFFIAGLTFASWASRIPDIKNKLHLSDGGLGAVLFALPLGSMTSLPISGYMVSHFGSRTMLLIASIIYPVVLIFIGLVNTPWQLGLVLFVFGLFGNLFNISVNTQAVGVEALYGRSIMASFHGLWSLAGFTGAAIGTLITSFDLQPFAHFIIICSITFLLMLFFYKDSLPTTTSTTKQPIFVLPDSSLIKLGLLAFFCMVCEGTMFDWSGVYFDKIVKAPRQLITLGYVAFMSSMAGGRFAGDWLANRFGKKTMLQISGILIAVGLAISIFFSGIITATIGFLMVGMGVSSVVPLAYGEAGRSSTMSPGAALAAVSTIGFLGFLIGPPMIGLIAQATDLRWSFGVVAILGFCTTLISSKLKLKDNNESDTALTH
ncbi:MAG: MFS transporter [Ginsengibacter sp.]